MKADVWADDMFIVRSKLHHIGQFKEYIMMKRGNENDVLDFSIETFRRTSAELAVSLANKEEYSCTGTHNRTSSTVEQFSVNIVGEVSVRQCFKNDKLKNQNEEQPVKLLLK